MTSCGVEAIYPHLETLTCSNTNDVHHQSCVSAQLCQHQQQRLNLLAAAMKTTTPATIVGSTSITGTNGGDKSSSTIVAEDDYSNESDVMKLARKFNKFYYGGFKKNECKPFYCDGYQIGLIRPAVEVELIPYPDVFQITSDRVTLNPLLKTFHERSAKIDMVLRSLRDKNVFIALRGWRNENYEIKPNYAQPPLFRMERSATCMFGLRQYGIDVNGYTNHPELGLCMWMQRRAKTKPTWPGMLDNFVAGGLSEGYTVLETAMKEAEEEANVPLDIARRMHPAGCVSFFFESERGIFPQTEFVFDIELPADFTPTVNDGEAENFELVPVNQVLSRLFEPDVKTTSTPIAVDFLVRKGIINPENEPNYPELVENLHIPLHRLYDSRPKSSIPPHREP